MKLITLLKKHFDIEEQTGRDDANTKDVRQIWVYERGQDSEPLLILKNAQDLLGLSGWVVGNVYSCVQHGLLADESQLKQMMRSGGIKRAY